MESFTDSKIDTFLPIESAESRYAFDVVLVCAGRLRM